MAQLKAEYSDQRVCKKCGAPAEILGYWRDGVFNPRPVSMRGGTVTHWCIRPYGESPDGRLEPDEWGFSCGALPTYKTTAVDKAAMAARCFTDQSQIRLM